MHNRTEKQINIDLYNNKHDAICEKFCWSNDKVLLQESALELIEFDDDLKFAVAELVIQGIGSKRMGNTVVNFQRQLDKTLDKFIRYELEKVQ